METLSMEIVSCSWMRFATTKMRRRMINRSESASTGSIVFHFPHQAFISQMTFEVNSKRYAASVGAKIAVLDPDITFIGTKHDMSSTNLNLTERQLWSELHVDVLAEGNVEFVLHVEYQEILQRSQGVYRLTTYAPFEEDIPIVDYKMTIIEQQLIDKVRFVSVDEQKELTQKIQMRVLNGWNVSEIDWSADKDMQNMYNSQRPSHLPSTVTLQFDPVIQHPISDIIVNDHSFSYWLCMDKMEVLNKNIILVLDKTTSMQGKRWTSLVTATKKIIDSLGYKDYFNLVTFADTSVKWEHESKKATNHNKAKAIEFLEKTRPNGNTNLGDALRMGYDLLVKDANRQRDTSTYIFSMFLVLDGRATVGETRSDALERMIVATRQPALRVFSVALGSEADYSILRRLAARTQALATRVTDGDTAHEQILSFYLNNLAKPVFVLDSVSNVTYTHASPYDTFAMVVDQSFQSDRMPMVMGSSRLIVGHAAEEKPILSRDNFKLTIKVASEKVGEVLTGSTDVSLQPHCKHGLDVPGPTSIGELIDRLSTHLAIYRQMDIARFKIMEFSRQRELLKICSILSRKHKLLTTTTAYLIKTGGSGIQLKDAYVQLAGESQVSSLHSRGPPPPPVMDSLSLSSSSDVSRAEKTISSNASVETTIQMSNESMEMMSDLQMKKRGESDAEIVDPQALAFWLKKVQSQEGHIDKAEDGVELFSIGKIFCVLVAVLLYWFIKN